MTTIELPEIPSHVLRLVRLYLIAKAHEMTLREQVDKMYEKVLADNPIYADRFGSSDRILSHKLLYKCSDDNAVKDIYLTVSRMSREAGIKPADMDDEICPALKAESVVMDIEHTLIDLMAGVLTVERKTLQSGLMRNIDKRQEFIDLTVKAAIHHEAF